MRHAPFSETVRVGGPKSTFTPSQRLNRNQCFGLGRSQNAMFSLCFCIGALKSTKKATFSALGRHRGRPVGSSSSARAGQKASHFPKGRSGGGPENGIPHNRKNVNFYDLFDSPTFYRHFSRDYHSSPRARGLVFGRAVAPKCDTHRSRKP